MVKSFRQIHKYPGTSLCSDGCDPQIYRLSAKKSEVFRELTPGSAQVESLPCTRLRMLPNAPNLSSSWSKGIHMWPKKRIPTVTFLLSFSCDTGSSIPVIKHCWRRCRSWKWRWEKQCFGTVLERGGHLHLTIWRTHLLQPFSLLFLCFSLLNFQCEHGVLRFKHFGYSLRM